MNIQETFNNNSEQSQTEFLSVGQTNQIIFVYDQDLQQIVVKNTGDTALQVSYTGKIDAFITKSFNCPEFCDGDIIYIRAHEDMFFSNANSNPDTKYAINENGACMVISDLTILEATEGGFMSYDFNFSFKNVLGNSKDFKKGINELKMDYDSHFISF